MGLTPVEAPAVFSLLAAIELDDASRRTRRGAARRWRLLSAGRLRAVPPAARRRGDGERCRYTDRDERRGGPVDEGRATGVRTASGETIKADAVVVNADLAAAEPKLLGSESALGLRQRSATRRRRSRSCGRWTGASSSCSITTSSCPRMRRMPTTHSYQHGTTSCRRGARRRRSRPTGSISICVVIVGRTRPRRRPTATRSWSCVLRRPSTTTPTTRFVDDWIAKARAAVYERLRNLREQTSSRTSSMSASSTRGSGGTASGYGEDGVWPGPRPRPAGSVPTGATFEPRRRPLIRRRVDAPGNACPARAPRRRGSSVMS